MRGSDTTLAANLVRSSRSLAAITLPDKQVLELTSPNTVRVLRREVAAEYWKSEPFWMDRHTQLALENIKGKPMSFVTASAKRLFRMFVVLGLDDARHSTQTRQRQVVFAVGTALSLGVFVLFAAGVALSSRLGHNTGVFLAAVVYLPLTIFPFLTNMRYTVSVQPFMLVFVAVSLVTIGDRLAARRLRRPEH